MLPVLKALNIQVQVEPTHFLQHKSPKGIACNMQCSRIDDASLQSCKRVECDQLSLHSARLTFQYCPRVRMPGLHEAWIFLGHPFLGSLKVPEPARNAG